MSEQDFEHPFGDRIEGSQVRQGEPTHLQGYQPRGRYVRSAISGKSLRVDHFQKEPTVTTALVERPATLPSDQIDLVRRTVAKDATNDELALYLYDCQRRGIHPLDKLLHFTKRGGKYTPVTSIDFMRAQAAMSGEMAGSDDPRFEGTPDKPVAATVTVYRITQGQRYAYQATARWSEYCPDNAQMWRKMPHTMLGKCAEALALRKAFPQQLAGLYSTEEMQQADSSDRVAETVDARASTKALEPVLLGAPTHAGSNPAPVTNDEGPDHGVDLPPGARLVTNVGPGRASAEGEITFNNGDHFLTWKKGIVDVAKLFMKNRTPCFPGLKTSATGNQRIEDLVAVPKGYEPVKGLAQVPDVDVSDVPF